MMKKTFIKYFFIALLIWIVWIVFPEKTISHEPGILVTEEPKRTEIRQLPPFPYKKKYNITLLQGYEVKARLLHKKNYLFLDSAVDLAPIDMVLGWGIMSDSEVLDHMSFSIMNRYYRAYLDDDAHFDWSQIEPYLDNNHLIPATGAVETALKSARVGDLIHLKGFLVDVSKPNGYRWSSSTSNGSVGETVMTCKLIYVIQFDIIKQQ